MQPIKGQYLVDAHGRPRAVVLDLQEYRKMMKLVEDARDAIYIRRHRQEKLISMQEVHRRLKKESLV